MTPAYIELVWKAYKLKASRDDASFNLKNPTRANLKSESYKVCYDRFSRKDGSVLDKFFGEGNDKEQLLKKINELAPDHFAALRNFITGKTPNPITKTVEILAWLIDFQPRPYQSHIDYEQLLKRMLEEYPNSWEGGCGGSLKDESLDEEDSGEEGEFDTSVILFNGVQSDQPTSASGSAKTGDREDFQSNDGNIKKEIASDADKTDYHKDDAQITVTNKNDKPDRTQPPNPRPLKKTLILVGAILAIITSFLLYKNYQPIAPMGVKMDTFEPVHPDTCMIWSIDHYEGIPCDYRYDEGDAVPLDSVVLRKFKKIINPETIGIDDKQKVWYDKQDNKIEFFTDSGMHPVNKKRLKPLTDRIYIYHILPLRDSLTR